MQACQKPENLLAQLKAFDIFSNVPDEALEWLIAKSEYYCLEKDEYLFRAGEEANQMEIMLTGSYLVSLTRDGRKREMGVWEAPNVTGVLPFSRMTHVGADGITLEPSTILSLSKGYFIEMVNTSYDMTQALVAVMTERVRDFQQIQLMDEKLMALGKMSAGLAHELNNPASAMVRSSQELHKHLSNSPERFKEAMTMRVEGEDIDAINNVIFERITTHVDTQELSLMEREERMDDLTDWFEDHNIEDSEEAIETFVDWDFRPEHLDQVAEALPEAALAPIIWWVETSLTTEGLVEEIQTASSRIAELVSSIKSYSHMDSEPSMEFVDIHKGITSTLTMMKYRFKKKRIELDKTYDLNLPHIKALEGELNQVWTNLISNALDVLPDDGSSKITIRSYQQRDNLCIDFADNGPGIPEEIQSRVFDPFFTTKGIGEGTGMGLDIVRRVLQHHGGTISVESEPGRTCFLVCFPM